MGCVFYGDGGDFHGEPFERWLADLEANHVKKYVRGAGPKSNLPGGVRAREKVDRTLRAGAPTARAR